MMVSNYITKIVLTMSNARNLHLCRGIQILYKLTIFIYKGTEVAALKIIIKNTCLS